MGPREKLLRWFAMALPGSPSFEQLSPEQLANVEALATATEKLAKEKAMDLTRYNWEQPPVTSHPK